MVAKLTAAGATEVISHGASWQNADDHLRAVVIPKAHERGEEGVYIPPFDHEAIWEGAGSMVEEIMRQMPDGDKPDAIVCSVGGGGLLAGVMNGLDRVGWAGEVQVLATETRGADSLAQALKVRELIALPGITSIATSLGAVRVARKAFEEAQRKNVRSVVLEDAEACMGCWRLADDERILVEPACGVSVALCYDGRLARLVPGFNKESKVVVVVCGGSRITLDMLQEYKRVYGQRAAQLQAELKLASKEDEPR